MNIIYEYSHFGGNEILKIRYPKIRQEILNTIKMVNNLNTLVNFNLSEIGMRFNESLISMDFQPMRIQFNIKVPNSDYDIKSEYKNIEYLKEKVMVKIQLEKEYSLWDDFSNFQYFYKENIADVGIEIIGSSQLLPENANANISLTQNTFNIERIKYNFPVVPSLLLIVN